MFVKKHVGLFALSTLMMGFAAGLVSRELFDLPWDIIIIVAIILAFFVWFFAYSKYRKKLYNK